MVGVASSPRVSVVMPTLNEAGNLSHVFAALPSWLHEVIVVDGRSTDGTVALARRLRPSARVIVQTRKGKGNALACGFEAATGDIIATIDADGSADPAELPRFVKALLDGADFAKGTRFAGCGGSADITRLRTAGNRALGWLVNWCLGTCYTDLCYGYNVFWRRLVPLFALDADGLPGRNGRPAGLGDGFEVEALMHLRAAQAGLRVVEVPSYEHKRIHGASNLNTLGDGLRVLRTILRENRRAIAAGGGAVGPAPAPGTATAALVPSHVIARGQETTGTAPGDDRSDEAGPGTEGRMRMSGAP